MDLELKRRTIRVGRRYITATELTIAQLAERGADLLPLMLYAGFIRDVRGEDVHKGTIAMDAIALRMGQHPREIAGAFSASCLPRGGWFRPKRNAVNQWAVLRMTRLESYALLAAVLELNGWDKETGDSGEAVTFMSAVARLCLLTGWSIDQARACSPRQVRELIDEHTRMQKADLDDQLMIMRAAHWAEDITGLHNQLVEQSRMREKKGPVDPRVTMIEMAEFCGDHESARKMRGFKQMDDALAERNRMLAEADKIIGAKDGHGG